MALYSEHNVPKKRITCSQAAEPRTLSQVLIMAAVFAGHWGSRGSKQGQLREGQGLDGGGWGEMAAGSRLGSDCGSDVRKKAGESCRAP